MKNWLEQSEVVGREAKDLLIDYYVGYTGDDIHIIMSHTLSVDNDRVHKLAWDAFTEGTIVAKEQGLYVPARTS